MRQKTKKLTDSEKQVLDLLWDSNEPLTSTEIVKLCAGRTWKPSYIHIMINSLLKKEMIKVAGFKRDNEKLCPHLRTDHDQRTSGVSSR